MMEVKLESTMNGDAEEIVGDGNMDMTSFERLLICSQRSLIKVTLLTTMRKAIVTK